MATVLVDGVCGLRGTGGGSWGSVEREVGGKQLPGHGERVLRVEVEALLRKVHGAVVGMVPLAAVRMDGR